MLNDSGFNAGPRNGAARVYHKNLLKVLESLKEADCFIQAALVQNLLIQAYDCLSKLKKADPSFNIMELENEYNYYKEQFLKQTIKT